MPRDQAAVGGMAFGKDFPNTRIPGAPEVIISISQRSAKSEMNNGSNCLAIVPRWEGVLLTIFNIMIKALKRMT